MLRFFSCFCSIEKLQKKKASFFQIEQLPKSFSIDCAEQQPSIILNSSNFACKHFQSAQNFVSFIDLNLFLVYFWFILLPRLALFLIRS